MTLPISVCYRCPRDKTCHSTTDGTTVRRCREDPGRIVTRPATTRATSREEGGPPGDTTRRRGRRTRRWSRQSWPRVRSSSSKGPPTPTWSSPVSISSGQHSHSLCSGTDKTLSGGRTTSLTSRSRWRRASSLFTSASSPASLRTSKPCSPPDCWRRSR